VWYCFYVFVVFDCMVLLCAFALCVYLCVDYRYSLCTTVLHKCMWLSVGVIINDDSLEWYSTQVCNECKLRDPMV